MRYVVIEYGCIECAGHPRYNDSGVIGIYDNLSDAESAAKQRLSDQGWEQNDRVLERRENDGALVQGGGDYAVEIHEVKA